LGKRELGEMERVDLEGFIEHEQDRGIPAILAENKFSVESRF
jgi:hypothetical protein